MKILLGNNYFSPVGGAEILLYWQYLLLKEKGFEVSLFATDKEPYFESEDLFPEYFPKSVDYSNLHGINKIKYSLKRFYNIEAEQKLDIFLKKIKPDIAHFGNIKMNLTPAVLNACYKNNIPVVITLFDSSYICPNGVLRINNKTYCKDELCRNGNYIHCVLNKCRGNSYLKSLNAACEISFKNVHGLYNGVSAFICSSNALAKLAINTGIPAKKIAVIPTSVPDNYLKCEPNYGHEGYFLYVGRIAEAKGINYLIEAFSKLPSEIKLRIVGTGPDENNLKLLAEKLNLNNVSFLGFKSGDELEEEYRNCIATILPCNWFENFPTTIIESFAHGKPVIASNLGGIPEMIENNKTGILIEPECIEDIVNAVKKMYYDDSFLNELSINCRQKAEKNYNQEIFYNNLINIYNNVLNAGEI